MIFTYKGTKNISLLQLFGHFSYIELTLYQYFGDEEALRKSLRCWQYIKDHLIDWEGGEWWWSCDPDGNINRHDDKAGFWKCPYHNSRMCLEIMERE